MPTANGSKGRRRSVGCSVTTYWCSVETTSSFNRSRAMRRKRCTRHIHHAAPAPTAAPVPISISDIAVRLRLLEDVHGHVDAFLAQLVREARHDAGRDERP